VANAPSASRSSPHDRRFENLETVVRSRTPCAGSPAQRERSKTPAGCRRYKNPLTQPHPRNLVSRQRNVIFGISKRWLALIPLALIYPRKPWVSGVLQRNGGASYASLPFEQPHPRNEQSARARSAETSKTPAGCPSCLRTSRRYKNPALACPELRRAPLHSRKLFSVTRHSPVLRSRKPTRGHSSLNS
jgi:hypothetical protein